MLQKTRSGNQSRDLLPRLTHVSLVRANMWCFDHFDLEMCFAPQRRAFLQSENGAFIAFGFQMCFSPERLARFQHLNIQERSEPAVALAFLLPHVLRATAVCNCSSRICPDSSAPAFSIPSSTSQGPLGSYFRPQNPGLE